MKSGDTFSPGWSPTQLGFKPMSTATLEQDFTTKPLVHLDYSWCIQKKRYMNPTCRVSIEIVASLASILASSTDLKKSSNSSHLFCGFGGDQTFLSFWSRCRVPVWAPAGYLAVKAAPKRQSNVLTEKPMTKLLGQLTEPHRALASWWQLLKAATGVAIGRSASTLITSCDIDSVQESKKTWRLCNLKFWAIRTFFLHVKMKLHGFHKKV